MNVTQRRPYGPGEILSEEFLEPAGITQSDFARRIGISRPRLNEIINGKRAITPDTAVRLSRALGTTPDFWLNLQLKVDLWDTLNDERHKAEYKRIKPLRHVKAA